MKKNKKALAITLGSIFGVCALLGSAYGIYRGVNVVEGTQAAKILLARENMNNASANFEWNDLFSKEVAQAPVSANASSKRKSVASYFASPSKIKGKPVNSPGVDLGTIVHDSPAGKVYKNNGEYIFKDISGASYQGVVVESRLKNIDYRVEEAAKNINYLKNELNIVNKWVKDGYSKFYLDVTSNRETLIEYYKDDKGLEDIWVVERETRQDANSVYSLMYTDMQTGKVNNPTFLVYIPNERYEYYYGHAGNSTDYLIAEQDKGYWNVFMPDENDYYNVTVNGDFAFQSSGSYEDEGDDYGTVGTTSLKEDVITNHSSGISVYLSAFDGISGVYVPEENAYEETYDGGEKSYINVDYSKMDEIKIGLNSGGYLQEGDEFNYSGKTVKIDYTHMQFLSNPGFADPQYEVSFSLNMGEGLTLKEKLSVLEEFLSDKGLTCKYDLAEIENNIIKNSEIANSLTSFYTWNGYLINSSENFKKAENVIFEKIDDMFAEYESAKNAEEVSGFLSARVARSQTFGKISAVNLDGAQYTDGKVKVNGVSLVAEKSNLMESGKQYKLQIGLARTGENGELLSQNTVNLATEDNVTAQTYNEEELSLSVSGSYQIPTALEEGLYEVVVYVATADEGIRVSEMRSIGVVDTVNESIETDVVKIEVKSNNGKLTVEYSSKLFYNIAVSGEVTYSSLRRKMMAEVLKYGYPMTNEEIQNANGEVVTDGAIASGEYKIKFVVSTVNGPVTGYVICTVQA